MHAYKETSNKFQIIFKENGLDKNKYWYLNQFNIVDYFVLISVL